MTKFTFNLRYNYNIITYKVCFMWGLSCEIEVFISSLLSILYLYMYIQINVVYNVVHNVVLYVMYST